MLAEAKRLAALGVSVHPLHKGQKRPIANKWSEAPFWTPEALDEEWRDGWNLGIRLGEPSKIGSYHLYVLDIDIKGDADDEEECYAALDEILPGWEDYPHVLSGGGRGRHIYIFSKVKERSHVIAKSKNTVVWTDKAGKSHKSNAWEVEFFGTGKQVATAPSIHPETGKAYKWGKELNFENFVEFGIGPIIDKNTIERWLGGQSEPESKRSSTRKDSGSSLLHDARAADIMDNRDGSALTRKQVKKILNALPDEWAIDYWKWLDVGFALHHQYQGDAEGAEIWEWYSVGEPEAWTGQESIKTRWPGMGRSYDKRKPVTMRTLYAAAQEANEDFNIEDEDEISKKLRKLSEKHTLVILGSKTLIAKRKPDEDIFQDERHFQLFYRGDKVPVFVRRDKNGDPVFKDTNIATLWLDKEAEKTKCEEVCFIPKDDVGARFNLWRGFSVEPSDEGSCDLFLKHIWNNVVKRDEALYDWVLGWLAHIVQRPWEKPGTALVLIGRKGTGKSFVGQVMQGLIRFHTATIGNSKHLTSNFNKRLGMAIFVRVEEAFWVGDKAAGQTLKDMITGDRMTIEPKGIDATEVDSFHRYLFTSNEKWAVPAADDERRYCVLHVGADQMQNRAYFGAILDQLRNGGYGALMKLLMEYDLSKIDVGTAPNTRALAEQKLQSMTGMQRWWQTVLSDGELGDKISDFDNESACWPEGNPIIPKSELRKLYEDWNRGEKYEGRPGSPAMFEKDFYELCPAATPFRARKGKVRTQCIMLPTLQVAREIFDEKLKFPFFGETDQ